MKEDYLKKNSISIYSFALVALLSLSLSYNAAAQNRELNIPEVQYTSLEDYYSTGTEIACTASVYSNGLIDQLCAIYYEIYKDEFVTPITSVGAYGSISYTVRSQGSDYITQEITGGSGYLSVKPLFTSYKAFTLGIFDNYCVNRNRPVLLLMTFNEPGVYKFKAEIQSCTNSGSSTLTNFSVPTSAPEGCVSGSHSDKAASSCSNPTHLFSDAIYITICEDNFIEYSSGATEYCPSEEINLVYNIGEYDDEVDLALLPSWITPTIDQNANTLTLTGNAPAYDSENSIITFDVRILSSYNPIGCPGAVISQSLTIKNAQTPVIYGENMTCEGGTVMLTSDIAATWLSSNTEVGTIEQTASSTEATVVAQNSGVTYITCQINENDCDVNSEVFVFDVLPNYEITITESICEGGYFLFGLDELSIAGEYTQNNTSQSGCDSTLILNLLVNELANTEFYIEDESYTWNETQYDQSGDYVQILIDANGCDSTVTLHLTVITNVNTHPVADGAVSVYPNPVSENLCVDIEKDNCTAYSIILTDITGKVLVRKDNVSQNNVLDLAPLVGGIYFVSILNEHKIIFTSIINKE